MYKLLFDKCRITVSLYVTISMTVLNLSAVLVFSGLILIPVSEMDVLCHFLLSGVLITISELGRCSDI